MCRPLPTPEPVRELLDQIVRRAAAGEAVAACALVAARGSTPQKPPALMVVLADGQTLGTIGGGCVEAEVRARALRLLAAAAAPPPPGRRMTFRLDQDLGWDDGLVCGGTMEVAVQVVASPAGAAAYQAARDALAAGRPATLGVTAVDDAGRTVRDTLALDPQPALVIAGAGHVGQALAAVAAVAGFGVTVVDDRPDVASVERFPGARRVIGPIDTALARLVAAGPDGGSPLGGTDPVRSDLSHTYVVIVTRGHRNDAAALAAVVRSPVRYVGLIGSRRKVVAIFRDLHRAGVGADLLGRVRAPVGLDVGAVTPGEIAVSIAAELVATRRSSADDAARPPGGAMRLSPELLARVLAGPPEARDGGS